SRIDTQIDKKIDTRVGAGDAKADELKALRGKVAIASAKIAYQRYLEILGGPRWKALSAVGASPQRLLWASTGTKDPAFSDVLYVETLIGPDTVNTMPTKTLEAFKDHGKVSQSLTHDVEAASDVLIAQAKLGLDLDEVTKQLVVEGVASFSASFDQLLNAVAAKRVQILGRAA
ncbi:MAG TPA: transaldolase family protein, partial [Caulobacteraceae bacterium]|nr:transaldolase family protein [Caulobacteraceae bacterium]